MSLGAPDDVMTRDDGLFALPGPVQAWMDQVTSDSGNAESGERRHFEGRVALKGPPSHPSAIHRSSHSLNPTNSIMSRPVTKVIYKPDSQSTEEFTVIVIPEEVRSLLRMGNRIFISCV